MFKQLVIQFVIALLLFGVSAPIIANTSFADTPVVEENESTLFEVSRYLKIDNGQTYLENKPGVAGTTSDAPNLKNGAVYFIIKFIELLTRIIGSLALLFLIVGGLTLMISHGNSGLQTKGKQMILYALIGVVVAFSSLIIVTFVQSLFYTV